MDYKRQVAKEATDLIKKDQVIGLGAGSTIGYLIDELRTKEFIGSISFVSSSRESTMKLESYGLKIMSTNHLSKIDIYFDGCDQVDWNLNALKSGGGIHTDEKALASMANEFIILGDLAKSIDFLNTEFPLTIEVLDVSISHITSHLRKEFDVANIKTRTDVQGIAVQTIRGTKLIEIKFNNLPDLAKLNQIKFWPGVIDHSLFYQMATGSIICGPDGCIHRSRS